MFKIIRRDTWSLKEVKANPNVLYLYFDADYRVNDDNPLIKGYPNTIGIPIRKEKDMKSEYMDSELADNVDKINKAVVNVIIKAKDYDYVVIPYCEKRCTTHFKFNSFGTYTFLKHKINILIQIIIDNEIEYINSFY